MHGFTRATVIQIDNRVEEIDNRVEEIDDRVEESAHY